MDGKPSILRPTSCVSSPVLTITLRLKIAQKPCMVWSLGPKALEYEFVEPKVKPTTIPSTLRLTLHSGPTKSPQKTA